MLSDQLRASGLKENTWEVFLHPECWQGEPFLHAPSCPGQQRALQLHDRQRLQALSLFSLTGLPDWKTNRNSRPEPLHSHNGIPLKTYSHSLRIISTFQKVKSAPMKGTCVGHHTAGSLGSHQFLSHLFYSQESWKCLWQKFWGGQLIPPAVHNAKASFAHEY